MPLHTLAAVTALMITACGLQQVQADERHWALDRLDAEGLDVYGQLSSARGVKNSSVLFEGNSLITVADSASLASQNTGFTLLFWVNPHSLHHAQQIIIAKNRYSLNELISWNP